MQERSKRPGFDPWVGKIPWRRAWLPTPLFLPGESHGQRSLVAYRLHGVAKSQIQLSDYTCIIVYLWVFEEIQHCFPQVPHHFAFHQHCTRVPFSLHPYENLLHFVLFLTMVILTGWGWYLSVLLILISLMINGFVPFCIHAGLVFVFFGEIYIQVLCSFLNQVLFICFWVVENFL